MFCANIFALHGCRLISQVQLLLYGRTQPPKTDASAFAVSATCDLNSGWL